MKPIFRELRETRTVDMWSSQLFHCDLTSDPPSISDWSKELPIMNGGVKIRGENFQVFINRSFVIRNVTWNDRGNYFCNALNSEGSTTRLIELTVNGMISMLICNVFVI